MIRATEYNYQWKAWNDRSLTIVWKNKTFYTFWTGDYWKSLKGIDAIYYKGQIDFTAIEQYTGLGYVRTNRTISCISRRQAPNYPTSSNENHENTVEHSHFHGFLEVLPFQNWKVQKHCRPKQYEHLYTSI